MRSIAIKALLIPFLGLAYLLMGIVVIPAWLVSWIPYLGTAIFVAALILISPLIVAAQWLGMKWVSLDQQDLTFGEDSLRISISGRSQNFKKLDIAQIIETFNPPCLQISIEHVDGSVTKLNPFTDCSALWEWAEKQGIPTQQAECRTKRCTPSTEPHRC